MRVVHNQSKQVYTVEDREDFYMLDDGRTELPKDNYIPLIEQITSLDEYQKLAARTLPDLTEFYGNGTVTIEILDELLNCNEIHCAFGIDTELGEVLDLYKKSFAYRKTFDKINLIEEICDKIWYIAGACTTNQVSLKTVIELDNIVYTGSYIPKENFPTMSNMADVYNAITRYNSNDEDIEELLGNFLLSEEELFRGLTNNINKLIIRYPEKFNNIDALNRSLDVERNELEK